MNHFILCIGAALLDEIYFSQAPMRLETSNPAQGSSSIGGVMTNVAHHLAALDLPVTLLTALGNDAAGNEIMTQLTASGIQMTPTIRTQTPTGKYIAFHQPNGELLTAICQDEATAYITPDYLASQKKLLQQARYIIADTNLSQDSLQWLSSQAALEGWNLVIEPVSIRKATKLNDIQLNQVALITPNEEELEALGGLKTLFTQGVKAVWVRKGSAGSTIYTPIHQYELGVPTIQVKDTTGAGDAALGGWIYAQYKQYNVPTSLAYGHALALHILQQKGAVDTQITAEQFEQIKQNYYP
ncbi:MAG: Pseudouridine kinase [Bacteroidota bacterium]|jgi:pseudouridine kinase